MDFYAAIIYALQGANWQRAGGPADKHPEHITRPREDYEQDGEFSGGDELAARKQAFYDELERRRNLAKGVQSG